MKNSKIYLLFFLIAFAIKINAQVSFTISPSLCAGNTATVVMTTGTLSALAYSWGASPTGPVFSASSSATTAITFPSAGTFTIGAGILTGSGYSYTLNTIVINPSPTLVVSASSSTICTGQSVTLTASGATTYTWAPAISLNTTSGFSVIASPSVTTAFNVTGILGSCTASVSVPIIVNPSPSSGSISINSSAPGGVCTGFTATLTAFGANSYTWTGTTFTNSIPQQSISVSPGNYTVVSGGAGCTVTATALVPLLPNLTFTPTASSATTCIENNFPKFSKPVHLSVSGASSYTWLPYNSGQLSGNGIDVRPAASTCYTVIGATAVCSGTGVSCVIVIPQFSITVSPATPSICLSQSVTLGISNVGFPAVGPASSFTYNWAEAPNAPPISISNYFTPTVSVYPQNSTTYTVEVKDAVGCISFPEMVAVSVLTCTGIENNAADKLDFLVYPNPAQDKLIVHSEKSVNAILEIINSSGGIISKHAISFDGSRDYKLDLSSMSPGLYFIKMDQENSARQLMRFIKE